MKITFFYNEYSAGGYVFRKRWELDPAENTDLVRGVTLKTAEVTLPDDVALGKTPRNRTVLFDRYDDFVSIGGDIHAINLISPCSFGFIRIYVR